MIYRLRAPVGVHVRAQEMQTENDTICPKCGTAFQSRKHRVFGNLAVEIATTPPRASFDAALDDAARVRCPQCQNVFVSEGFRYFGLLRRKGMRALATVLMVAILLLVAYAGYFAQRVH